MTTINKILIVIDYHPNDSKIASIGYAIAKDMDAEIILFHAIDSVTHYTSLLKKPIKGISNYDHCTFYKYIISHSIQDAVIYYLTKIEEHFRNNIINIHLENDSLSMAMYQTVLDLNINLIVLGSHNKNYLNQVMTGNLTEEKVNYSPIPLLVVPTLK